MTVNLGSTVAPWSINRSMSVSRACIRRSLDQQKACTVAVYVCMMRGALPLQRFRRTRWDIGVRYLRLRFADPDEAPSSLGTVVTDSPDPDCSAHLPWNGEGCLLWV